MLANWSNDSRNTEITNLNFLRKEWGIGENLDFEISKLIIFYKFIYNILNRIIQRKKD